MTEAQEPVFLQTAEAALYTIDLLNLEDSSEQAVSTLMGQITSHISQACRHVFHAVMQDIEGQKMFVLFEPKLNCDVATDHLAPKSVLPLFSDFILEQMDVLIQLLGHSLYCDISEAFEAVIKDEVSEKLVYEQRSFYQNHQIHMLLEQLDQMQALLVKISARLSSQAIDELRLIQQIVEQAKARMRIGFVYESDFRDLKFDSNEKEASGNDAASRMVKRLSNQVIQLKNEIGRLKKENNKILEYKVELADRDKQTKKLQDALEQLGSEVLLQSVSKETHDSASEEQSSASQEEEVQTAEGSLLQALQEENQELNIWLAELKKEFLRSKEQYELEIERITNQNISLEANVSRPSSSHSSCSYHGSRVGSAKRVVHEANGQLDQIMSQLAKYQKLFQLITGFDVGVSSEVNIERELVNFNLQDELLKRAEYMFENAITMQDRQIETEAARTIDHGIFKAELQRADSPLKGEFIEGASPEEDAENEDRESVCTTNTELRLSQSYGSPNSQIRQLKAENDKLHREAAADKGEILELKDKLSSLLARVALLRPEEISFESADIMQHDELTEAQNLLSYTKESLKELDLEVLDKGIQTGLDIVSSNEVGEEHKRQRMLAEAGKYLRHSDLTRNILDEGDSAFNIYQKLFQTRDKIERLQGGLLEERRKKAEIEYEKVLRAYRVHVDENISSIIDKIPESDNLRLFSEKDEDISVEADVKKHQPHLYKQKVLLPAEVRRSSAENDSLMTITSNQIEASNLVRTNSYEHSIFSGSNSRHQEISQMLPEQSKPELNERGLDCNLEVRAKFDHMPALDDTRAKPSAKASLPYLEMREAPCGEMRENIKAPHESNLLMSVNTKSRIILEVKKEDIAQTEAEPSVFRGTNMAKKLEVTSQQRSRSQGGYLNDDELFTAVLELQGSEMEQRE